MAPPVRTNLDQRMNLIKETMDEFFESITKEYKHAVNAVSNPSEVPVDKVLKLRERAQRQAEALSQELLLVLTLNQPLLQDLRVIAAYLRGVDVIERLARHARMFHCVWSSGPNLRHRDKTTSSAKDWANWGKMSQRWLKRCGHA